MGKKTPSPPAAPDPMKTAVAQGAINREAAIAQAELNRINEYTPYGSSVYSPDGVENPDTGITPYRRTTTLDPGQQNIFDQQTRATGALNTLAADQTGRVAQAVQQPFSYAGLAPAPTTSGLQSSVNAAGQALSQPFNYQGLPSAPTSSGVAAAANMGAASVAQPFSFSGLPAAPTSSGIAAAANTGAASVAQPFSFDGLPAAPTGDAAARQQTIDSVYNQYTSRLDPRFAKANTDLQTSLANQGFAVGGDAYNSAFESAGRTRNDAYQQALNAAVTAGGAEQSRLFGLGDTARQRATAEALTLRGMPMSEQAAVQGLQQTAFSTQASERDRAAAERSQQRQAGLTDAQQVFNLQSVLYGLQGNERERAIQEAAYLRNVPLNETTALMGTGPGISNPQFSAAPQGTIAPANYQAQVNANYQGALGNYNQQVGANNAAMGGLFGLAGAVGGGLAAGPMGASAGSAVGRRLGGGS